MALRTSMENMSQASTVLTTSTIPAEWHRIETGGMRKAVGPGARAGTEAGCRHLHMGMAAAPLELHFPMHPACLLPHPRSTRIARTRAKLVAGVLGPGADAAGVGAHATRFHPAVHALRPRQAAW